MTDSTQKWRSFRGSGHAAQACKNFSTSNIYGSLAITYADLGKSPLWPFMLDIDRNTPVHVFDSHNLPIILNELDTIKDFSDYLDAKMRAVASLDMLSYCGEEDLLAHYWLNTDPVSKRHYIGTSDPKVNAVIIGEGEWHDLLTLPQYEETKRANQKSYLWDEMIQRTCDNWRAGTLMGDGELLSGRGAIHEMAKEPRFMRREIVERILHAIQAFPERKDKPTRYLCFFSSYYPEKGYVFLQLWVPPHMRGDDKTYRAKRQEILRIACGVAKNKNPNLKIIVGIAIPPPKFEREIGEDSVWLDCSNWSNEIQAEYAALNSELNFFETGLCQEKKINEFMLPQPLASQPPSPDNKKIGRNQPCPCGSGIKFKRCHGSPGMTVT